MHFQTFFLFLFCVDGMTENIQPSTPLWFLWFITNIVIIIIIIVVVIIANQKTWYAELPIRIHVAWVKMNQIQSGHEVLWASVRSHLLCSSHRNCCMHIAALKSAKPYFKTCLYMCFRVPTAVEVEKWKESFSHVMSSESECSTWNISAWVILYSFYSHVWCYDHGKAPSFTFFA